jgi:hypothetical protein
MTIALLTQRLQWLSREVASYAETHAVFPVVWDRNQGRAYVFTGPTPFNNEVIVHLERAAFLFTGVETRQMVGHISSVDVENRCATARFRIAQGTHACEWYTIQLDERNIEWVSA